MSATVSIAGVDQSTGALAAVTGPSTVSVGIQRSASIIPVGPYAGKALYDITIYGDGDAVDATVHFQFQTSEGEVFNLQETIKFSPNGVVGSLNAPYILTGYFSPPPSLPLPEGPPLVPPPLMPPLVPPPSSPKPTMVTQEIPLTAGWTWVSINVEADDMSPNTIFSGVSSPVQDGDYLKSQTQFSQYYAGFGFYGTLAEWTTNEMYKVKMGTRKTINFRGSPTPLPKKTTFTKGWNYMPCPHQTSTPLLDGMPALAWTMSDLLKSQTVFTTYCALRLWTQTKRMRGRGCFRYLKPPCARGVYRADEGYGWFGNLNTLDPGTGYKIKLGKGGAATFPKV